MSKTRTVRTQSTDRRSEIANAARDIIVEKGFEGLRTREIAERVGINIATLHYHVPSKDALIELIAETLAEAFREQHRDNARDHMTPLERLKYELADFRRMKEEDPDILAVMSELARRGRHDPKVAEILLPMRLKWHDQIRHILQDGVSDGSFRADLDPNAATMMITGAIVAFDHRPKELMAKYDTVADEIIRSVVRRPDKD